MAADAGTDTTVGKAACSQSLGSRHTHRNDWRE